MNLRPKQNNNVKIQNDDLYFSQGQEEAKKTKSGAKDVVKQDKVKHQNTGRSRKRPAPISNSTQIKLQASDIRYIENIVEQKHGKLLSREQMLSLRKKMLRQNFTESNPYTEMNYNTGERDQWKDNKKKTLTLQQLNKLKKHFLNIMKMVDRGQQSKYTLRDMSREFNLDESAFLQMKRQFQIDPDVSLYVHKTSNSSQPRNQASQISNRIRKKYIIQKFLERNSSMTRKQLLAKIFPLINKKNFSFPEVQIEKILQQEGYKWRNIVKTPKSSNFQANRQRRKIFCQKINFILTQTKYKVYFLGVLNFNSFMFRNEGWTKDQYLLEPQIDESFTLMALTERSGQGTWKFQKQVFKEEVFMETAKQLFELLLSDQFQPKYVVVDFSLHKYQQVLKKSRKKFDVQIVWLPPFSFLLNPLQFWFEEIKNFLSKSKKTLQLSQDCNMIANRNQILIKGIYQELCQVFKAEYNKNFQFTKYFEEAAKYHQKALKMQKL